jgi:hypothetical protein
MNRDEIAAKYIPCTCHEAYKSRNLAAPDCAFCQEDWQEAMDEYAERLAIDFCLDFAGRLEFPKDITAFGEGSNEEILLNLPSTIHQKFHLYLQSKKQ